jgi:hypothetical protein
MIILAMFNNLLLMKWDAVSVDSTGTGWLGHTNLVGPRDKDATNALNVRAVSLMGGKTAAFNHNTQVILKMVVTPPVGDNSINHLRRLDISTSVCLPVGHGFLTWVRTHLSKFNSFHFQWAGLEMQDLTLQHAKGIVYVHYLKIRFSCYFDQQKKTSTLQPLGATDRMISRIRDGNIAWAPLLLFALQTSLRVPLLSRLNNPALMQKPLGGGRRRLPASQFWERWCRA